MSFFVKEKEGFSIDYYTYIPNLETFIDKVKSLGELSTRHFPIFNYEYFGIEHIKEYDMRVVEKYAFQQVVIYYSLEERRFYIRCKQKYEKVVINQLTYQKEKINGFITRIKSKEVSSKEL